MRSPELASWFADLEQAHTVVAPAMLVFATEGDPARRRAIDDVLRA